MIRFVEHISHPGFGYLEPYMNADDPLIFRDVGERLVKVYADLHSEIRKLNNKLDKDSQAFELACMKATVVLLDRRYEGLLSRWADVQRWYESRDRTEFGWAKLDKIMENQDD